MKTLNEVKQLLGSLPEADLPLMLLPVQVQTRYVIRNDQPQLLVRVFPDEIHIDSHEKQLTSAEIEWGRRYWELIWPSAGDQAALRSAWEQLAARFGARRAAWVVRQLTPANPSERPAKPPAFPDPGPPKPADWTLPALARMLPDRWVVMGYAGGARLLLEVGQPIPASLAVSLNPDDSSTPPPGEGELPIDPALRWMVDFDEAEKTGMGIRIVLNADLAVKKLDRLLVFGLKAPLGTVRSAALLEDLLTAHHYTRGLAVLETATPTNNSAEASSGFSQREPGAQSSYLVEVKPPALSASAGGALAARLLGVRKDIFTRVEGAVQEEDLAARHMLTALWPATGRYYLEQILAQPEGQPPLFSPDDLDRVRRYCIDFARAGGPLPALRVGSQPYGVLPVLSLDGLFNAPGGQNRFTRMLRQLRRAWKAALPGVPRLGLGGQAADPLVEILRMQPVSVGFRGRLAFDTSFFVPAGVMQRNIDPDLLLHSSLLKNRLRALSAESLVGDGRAFDLLPAETARLLAAALVQPGGETPGAPLSPNYITFLRTARFDEILNEVFPAGGPLQSPPDSFFYLILRHSILLAYLGVAQRILIRRGSLGAQPFREPALVDIIGPLKPARTRTLLRILELDPALRESLHTLTTAQEPEAAELEELRASLAYLEKQPADVLARQMCACLDLFSYRLDAWITSLATQRLAELRTARPRGVGVGGFGWVEDLQPAPRTPVPAPPPGEEGRLLFAAREKGGFIHAPSLDQAAAAAVLRSGYLSQPGDGSNPFAIDLSSQRVRTADWLLDGIRQGQALGALLGYRFERGLHERNLDRFIAGFRRVALLGAVYNARAFLNEVLAEPGRGPGKIAQVRAAQAQLAAALNAVKQRYQFPANAELGAMEQIAAGQVADGLALSRLFAGGRLPFDDVVPPGGAPMNPTEQSLLQLELRALQEAVDALSDALTAEGVYQVVSGNPARAAASVDSVAHGEIQPPELTFTQIHRPGFTVTHRLAVIFSGPTPAAPAGARQFRAQAEPRLNAWLSQMLPALASVICLADFTDDAGKVIGARRKLPLSALGISHLDAVLLSAAAQPGQPTDLQRLLEYRLREAAPPGIPAGARLRFIYERPASGLTAAQFSLGQFLAMADACRRAILASRPLQGRDLAQSETEPPSGLDAAEFKARADQAVSRLEQALAALSARRAVVEGAPPTALPTELAALRERLLDLFSLGLSDALPVAPRGAGAAERDQLLFQARAVEQEAARRSDQAQAAESGFDRAAAGPAEQVEHDLARIKSVFGRFFSALPLVRPPNTAELNKAFSGSSALLGGDPLQALSWLQGAARVRPAPSALDAALSFAAALGRPSALELRVAQLPFQAGERWVGLPLAPGGSIPPGKISLVAHLPQPFKPAQPLAGLLVDAWVEVIPSPQVTSGVSFNFDAPGARPPQAVLLALTPPGTAGWEVETLEQTLLEALDLARLRAVDPQALGGEVLLQRLLPALYISNNLSGDTVSTDFSRAIH